MREREGERQENRRKEEERREKVDEDILEKRKRPPVPNWWHWPRPKLKSTHINVPLPQRASGRPGQTAASGEEAGAGQGRARQGTVVGGGGCSCQ